MRTKIILEIGCNHQGDINLAKKMIDISSSLGVHGVKFQKRDVDSIPPEIGNSPRDPVFGFGATYRAHRDALEFSQEQIFQLKIHAEKQGLTFCCTAFDLKSMSDLLEIGVEYIKLPSQLLLKDEMYLEYQKYKLPNSKLMVSTGMHSKNEILEALFYQPDIVYHCVSLYPAEIENCDIRFIPALVNQSRIFREDGKKGFEVGFSSHEKDAGAVVFAVTAGADWIERHFTLDKKLKGSDHSTVSSTPDEIKGMIRLIEMAEAVGGMGERILSNEEKNIAYKYRSSE